MCNVQCTMIVPERKNGKAASTPHSYSTEINF